MSQVSLATQRFGGLRKMARAAGIPVSTVDSWGDFIPAHQQIKILEAATREGVSLTAEELYQAARTDPPSVSDAAAEPGEKATGAAE